LSKATSRRTKPRAILRVVDESFKERGESAATKADIAEVRREIGEAKGDLIKWVVGIVGTQAVIVLGGVWFIVQHGKP